MRSINRFLKKNGYFSDGKFDQFKHNIPYAALVQALQAFVRQILSEDEMQITQWKKRLSHALGSNGKLIVDIIPELALILGAQPAVPEVGPTEAQRRFHWVFKNFVCALSSKERPFVLYLDDLQWADPSSLKLLEAILTEYDTQYLLIIGSYRDNEVDENHPVTLLLEAIQKKGQKPTFIKLGPLHPEDVEQLIAETLHCAKKIAAPLATLCYEKTKGNPFFLNQFLNTLYQESLITFDSANGIWRWDLEDIKKQKSTENVVELMLFKLDKLPKVTRFMLSLASCIGNQFDLNTLSIINEKSHKQTAEELWPALQEGVILPLEDSYKFVGSSETIKVQYQFLHDRVQQAAYSLIEPDQKKQVHLKIGRLLVQHATPEEESERIFDITNHLNFAYDLIESSEEKNKLAEFNWMAAKKAINSGVYEIAAYHAKLGLQQLGEDWNVHYNLLLRLYIIGTESSYLQGDFEWMNHCMEMVLTNAKTPLDKIKIYKTKISYYLGKGEPTEAVNSALLILKELGITFPKHPNIIHTLIALIRTKLYLGNKSIETLKNLPTMSDPYKLAAMEIITHAFYPIYVFFPKLAPLVLFGNLILTLKYGNNIMSGSTYGGYAVLLCVYLNKVDEGYQYGQLALSLAEQFNDFRAITGVNFVVFHWKKHIRETVKPLLDATWAALEAGDYQYAAGASACYCRALFFVSPYLAEVVSEIEKQAKLTLKIKQLAPYTGNIIFLQMASNFMECEGDPTILSGKFFNDRKIPIIENNESDTLRILFVVKFSKMILNYLFWKYSEAFELSVDAEKIILPAESSTPVGPVLNFYESLSSLAVYPKSSKLQKWRLMRRVLKNQRKMKLWGKNAPMNYLHKYHLVEAERCNVLGEYIAAATYYDKAINGAKENGYIQDEALANELCGKFYLARGKTKFGKLFISDASYCYTKWGAKTKVLQLEKHYPWLQMKALSSTEKTLITASASSHGTLSNYLDLNTVLEASQTIASELELEKLVSKLLAILIENIGAERGVLILESNQKLFIEGECTASGEITDIMQSKPITEDRLPNSIIQNVFRRQETVVLSEATNQNPFSNDSYIIKNQPKSILCVPIIHHNHLIGILYFENNLTSYAFDVNHLEVLSMLSGQIAVSIENAKLYQSFERFVPKDFLQLLGKRSLVDVTLGDYTRKTLTAMFIDIRDFTTISEKGDPETTFAFINQYLSGMEPFITKFHGFIDKYLGDAIMGLFPDVADDALNAGIEIQTWLFKFNSELKATGQTPIDIGIGINTGLSMLGMVGSVSRMDGTVLSDAINTASRIEGLNKVYGTQLIITENTVEALKNEQIYHLRQIDKVRTKGKSKPLRIFEVLDGLPDDQKQARLETLNDFNQAKEFYLGRNFKEAKLIFEACLAKSPNDRVCALYVSRCNDFIYGGCAPEWDGTTDFQIK